MKDTFSPAKVTIDLKEYDYLLKAVADIEKKDDDRITEEEFNKILSLVFYCFSQLAMSPTISPYLRIQEDLKTIGFTLELISTGVNTMPKVLLTKTKK